MLSAIEVDMLSPGAAALEKSEPLLSAWRYHANHRIEPARWSKLRALARDARAIIRRAVPLSRPRPGQVVVSLTAMTPSNVESLRPVMSQLRNLGAPVFLLCTPAASPALSDGLHEGHAYLHQIAAAAPISKRIELRRQAREFGRDLRRSLGDQRVEGAEQWIEFGLAIREAAADWISGASVLVCMSDMDAAQKGLVLGARSAGVPTAMLQHGFFGPHHFPFHTDRLFSWGEYFSLEAIRKYGSPPACLESLGSPRWDQVAAARAVSLDPGIHASIRKTERPCVLVISSMSGSHHSPALYDSFVRSLERLVNSDAVEVQLKLHPAEGGLQYYRGRVADRILENVNVVPPTASLQDALKCCDVALNVYSSGAIDAMLLGVPVLFEGRSGHDSGLCDYPDHGGGDWCSPDDVLQLCLDRARGGCERARALERQESFLDKFLANRGRAAEAICERIKDLSKR